MTRHEFLCAGGGSSLFVCEKRNVPQEKYDFIALAALIILKLEIVYGQTTFVLRQICAEIIIFARRRCFLHDYLRMFLVELEDDILVNLEFQIVKLCCTIDVCANAVRRRVVCKLESNYMGIY